MGLSLVLLGLCLSMQMLGAPRAVLLGASRAKATGTQFTLYSSASTGDRVMVSQDMIHLSDGTLVFIADPGDNTGGSLYYSSDHVTATLIQAIGGNMNANHAPNGNNMKVVRDNLDNLYVVATNNNVQGYDIECRAFTKGAGYTWTAQTSLHTTQIGTTASPIGAYAAVWCNTGGGTSSKGHLMVVGSDATTTAAVGSLWYATLDAGVALAGSGTLLVNSGLNPTFFGTTTTATGSNIDIAQDGFGVANGIAAAWKTSTTLTIGSWAVNSSGALSTNTNITTTHATGTMAQGTKVRVLRASSNVFVVAYTSATTAGKIMVARYSATALLTAGAEYGTVTNMPTPGATWSWDIFLDPTVASKVWLLGWHTGTATTCIGLSVDVSSGVTWAGTVTTQDTGVGSGGTNTSLRAVKEPIAHKVDWQTFNTNGGTYALLGDYTSF